jgi:cobalt/nickel transport system permease protein
VAISILPVGGYAALVVGWLAIVGLSVVARLDPLRTTRQAFFALPFVLAALPLIFTRPGEVLATLPLGPLVLTISDQGVREFTTIAFKSWVSVQAALLLTFTTPFHDLVDGLRQLRLPRIMVAIIGFTYRYLGVLTGEATRMNRARQARSAVAPGRGGPSLRWRATITGRMVGSLFLRSYERSERIYAAMQSRGFDGELRYLPGTPLARAALIAFVLLLMLLVLFVAAAHLWVPRL